MGIWVAIIGTLAVALEGSFLARYFTRFVQEIYSGLISLLFVYESIEKLVKVSLIFKIVAKLKMTFPEIFNSMKFHFPGL